MKSTEIKLATNWQQTGNKLATSEPHCAQFLNHRSTFGDCPSRELKIRLPGKRWKPSGAEDEQNYAGDDNKFWGRG
jgi:hypothetical protein